MGSQTRGPDWQTPAVHALGSGPPPVIGNHCLVKADVQGLIWNLMGYCRGVKADDQGLMVDFMGNYCGVKVNGCWVIWDEVLLLRIRDLDAKDMIVQ